jgi:hypothetical protein
VTRLYYQVAEVSQELDQLVAAADNRTLIAEYETATTELQEIGEKLSAAVQRRTALRLSGDDFQLEAAMAVEKPLFDRLKNSLEKVRQTWDDNRRKIRQGGAIGRLRTATEAYAQRVDGNSTENWEAWCKEVEGQFGIADAQLESITHVMNFRGEVARFRLRSEEFRSATRIVPRTPEALVSIRAIVAELMSIKGGLSFDLPPQVTAFYEELDRNGFVQLGTMSPTVEQWLADNRGLQDLVITRRPMVRR